MTPAEARKQAGRLRAARSPWCPPLDYVWREVVTIPHSYGLSKNQTHFAHGRRLTKEARDTTAWVAGLVARAVADQIVVQNTLWIDLFVEQPNARGDCINYLDWAADAVKVGLDFDDNWFSCAGITGAIVKDDECQLHIGFGQTADWSGKPCVICGQLLPFDSYRERPSGPAPECHECWDLVRELKKTG